MGRSKFWLQLKALLRRNILLKIRNKNQTFQEFFMPLYFLAILAIIRFTTAPKQQPAIRNLPVHKLGDTQFSPDGSKVLYVTPNTTDVRTFMDSVTAQFSASPSVEYFDSVNKSEEAYKQNTSRVAAGIDFDDGNLQSYTYTIRMPYGSIASTEPLVGLFTDAGKCRSTTDGLARYNCPANTYLYTGFAQLQRALDTAFIRWRTGNNSIPVPGLGIQMFPKNSFLASVTFLQIFASLYMVLAYSPFISFLSNNLVAEKEKKIKEGMRMMGMRDAAFWLSWGLIYVCIIFIVTLMVTFIAYIARFFQNSNMLLFFIFLFLYGLTIINLAFMVTPFFSKAETAGGLTSLAVLLISLIYLAVALTRTSYTAEGPVSSIPTAGQWALCLLSPVALALSIDQGLFLDVAYADRGGMGFQNLYVGQFPLVGSLVMLVVDMCLYGLLAVYFDNVIPTEYGTRRPPWFFLLPSYWCRREKTEEEIAALIDHAHGSSVALKVDSTDAVADVEPIQEELRDKNMLRIFNIKKQFKASGGTMAVAGISLDMYEGQITALLGHNGAGKTTLINMLTGMTSTSGGTATIYGLDVSDSSDMNYIRSMTGVCPQHNILFDQLSCWEHLQVYATLKGVEPHMLEAEIVKALQDVDLTEQKETWAKELSGGQKRKLSVAIALIGDPKVIFLDEPTAGMDPFSRRHLWSLLKAQRPGKIILLTTHFMDEADILADRKAIISKGKLRCCGSSLFLKNRFGIGYHLSMVVEPDANTEGIHDIIHAQVPDAGAPRTHGKELTYTLPLTAVGNFAALFRSFESPQGSTTTADVLGVRSYGVSMTTLEEVFLKLGDDEGDDDHDYVPNGVSPSSSDNAGFHSSGGSINMVDPDNAESGVEFKPSPFNGNRVSPHLTTTVSSKWQQFTALCKVRILQAIRNPMVIFFRVLMPVGFIIGGSALQRSSSFSFKLPVSYSLQVMPQYYMGTPTKSIPMLVHTQNPDSISAKFESGLAAQGVQLLNINATTNLTTIAPHDFGVDIVSIAQNLQNNITAMYNDTAPHSLPVTINLITNALMMMATGNFSNATARIIAFSKPWASSMASLTFNNGVFSGTLLMGMALASIPAGFAIGVIRDRQIKARSQLRISGVNLNMYWITVFVIDGSQFLCAALLSIVVLLAFQVKSMLYGGAILCLLLLYFFYVPVNMMLAYCFSFMFSTFDVAQAVLPNMFIFAGFVPYMAVSMLDMIGNNGHIAVIIHYVVSVIDPMYALFGGLYYTDRVYRIAAITQSTDNPQISFNDYFRWESHIPVTLVLPVFHAIWLYFLLRLLEVRSTGGDMRDVCACGAGYGTREAAVSDENEDIPDNEDDDVREERQKVENLLQSETDDHPVIMAKHLRKEFRKRTESRPCYSCKSVPAREKVKVAVRNNTFQVQTGEVFGLLGPNGAGKTTVLNMVIAEEGPTLGRVYVAGHELRSSLSEAFQAMGYCPQHDPLWDTITLAEHIEAYASIRGIPKSEIPGTIKYFTESLKVTEHANKQAKALSGGTKRKLSYALSMLGTPKVVLMDEPSTGMDPKSKRFLWDTISAGFNNDQRGAILTTHYMEEADALCSRVAIMVNGQIECLGSTQHLKNKYGQGYVLEVKLDKGEASTQEQHTDALHQFVLERFPEAVRTEQFGERAIYKIPKDNVAALSTTFAAFEEGKRSYGIEEYSFSQSTLEQVFLEFAKHQKEPEEDSWEDDENDLRPY